MSMNQTTQRTSRLAGMVVASLLMFAGCAEVGADDNEESAENLAQLADAGAAEEPHADLGVGNGKDVACIGDSWMSMIGNGDGIQGGLRRARKNYQQYGVLGTQLLNGQIPGQFDRAMRAAVKPQTIIMTGGGNDVLLTGASLTCLNKSCAQLKRIVEGLKKLWGRMATAGVKDVVYIGYAEGAGSTPAEVTNSAKNGVGEACDAMTGIRCHWIDSTPIIGGSRGLGIDGIHPTQPSNDKLAKAILDLMEKEGIRR